MRGDGRIMRHFVNQRVGQILGMRGHKANALDARLADAVQKLCKGYALAAVQAVAVYILPDQHDFLYAGFYQLVGLAHDIVRSTGTLTPAHIGHDAVGAEIVAAVHHRDIRLDIAFTVNRQALGQRAGFVFYADDALMVGNSLPQVFGQTIKISRAEGHVDKRILLEELLRHFLLLNHAAAHTDEHVRTLFFYFLQPGYIAQCLALGIIADAAGVVQHKIGGSTLRRRLKPHFLQHAGQLFAVVRVHLAAIGDDIIGFGSIRMAAHLARKIALALQFFLGDTNGFLTHRAFPPRGYPGTPCRSSGGREYRAARIEATAHGGGSIP